jgi:hypothetical protein
MALARLLASRCVAIEAHPLSTINNRMLIIQYGRAAICGAGVGYLTDALAVLFIDLFNMVDPVVECGPEIESAMHASSKGTKAAILMFIVGVFESGRTNIQQHENQKNIQYQQ